MPLQFLSFPRSSPYRAPRLASNRCCLSVAFMRPCAPDARSGSGADTQRSEPWKLRAGHSRARTHLRGEPACGSRLPTCGPNPPSPPRACSGPGRAGVTVGPSAVAPLQSQLCARSAPASRRPAPARFIWPLLPRVKRPAARRVQKPAGQGEEVADCNGCPGAAPEHQSPAPLGPGDPI